MLRRLAFALATTLVVLLAIEGALRRMFSYEELLFEWERADGWVYFEETGIVAMRPAQEGSGRDGDYEYRFATNEHGLREDQEILVSRGADILRILALGDSWMFGVNATQGRSLPARLESILSRELGGSVEVVNAGVVGGSAFDMLRIWRRHGVRLELDGVLLGQPHNDGRQREVSVQRRDWYAASPNVPLSEARLYLGLRRLLAPYNRPAYPSIQHHDTAIADLRQIVTEAQEVGLKAWFVAWPTRWADLAQVEGFMHEPWMEELEEAGAEVVGHLLDERPCWGQEDLHHPSEAGYLAVAETLAPVILGREPAPGQWVEEPRCRQPTN